MKKLLLIGALLAAGSLALQDVSVGHGGTYRGPGDTVPPGGGGGGGGGGTATPGPSGPSGPSGGPSTPGSSGPAGPAAGPGGTTAVVTGAGATGGTDLTVWQFWWGFNKDPYLNLKAAIHSGQPQTGSDDYFIGRGEKTLSRDTLRPNEEKIRGTIVPALLQALEKERQNDIVTGCLVALAKIGDAKNEQGESAFEKVISKFLSDSVQEIAETAAVALGILANDASVPKLVDLMNDTPKGRADVGSTTVNYRTRAFAAYGLGLIGYQTESNQVRRDIAKDLIEVLQLPRQPTRDLKVAATIALGLVKLDPGTPPSAPEGQQLVKDADYFASTRETEVRFLLDFFKNQEEHYLVRAHAPRAMALLVPEDDAELKGEIIEALLEAAGPHSKEEHEVLQSCMLALGMLGDCSTDPLDVKIRACLKDGMTRSGDQQVPRFATIALAQVAGRPGKTPDPDQKGFKDIRKELTQSLVRTGGGMSRLKPWIGLSLGVLQNARVKNGGTPDPEVGQVLRAALAECRTPADVGAYCIGAGIARDEEAKDSIVEKLGMADDEARGYAAVALGLMGARDQIETIQKIVKESKYRPELLKQAAIALGLLGDKQLVDDLVEMLREAKGLATQAAISSALGFIGDNRSVDPLVEMLQNQEITASARGFAAVALGIVADKEPLPWNSKISENINYRANTTTLTGENGTGILDIL
jgi:HEAT repeat protein